jgi:NAD(P)-dependent dehydrogenase (short-subunit alcohol dehydrogenase family)
MKFQDRVVIVTGGSKGIGEGCSRVFCAEGGLVAILSRGKEAGESLADELTKTGPGRAVYFPCDVGRHDSESCTGRDNRVSGSVH